METLEALGGLQPRGHIQQSHTHMVKDEWAPLSVIRAALITVF